MTAQQANRQQRRAEKKQRTPGAHALSPQAQASFGAAIQHHQAGRFTTAEPLYRAVLAASPRHTDSLQLLGVLAHQTGRNGEAVELIGRAISMNPNIAVYHYNLGSVRMENRQLTEAVACYRRALQITPDYPEAHFHLGALLKTLGRPDEAVIALRCAIALRPDYTGAHIRLGDLLGEQGEADAAAACYHEAICCYRKVLDTNSDDPETLNNLGNTLKTLGRVDEAIACYRRALEVQPKYADAHNNLGTSLARQGAFDDAVASYRRALVLNRAYPEAHNNLGTVLKEMGRLEEGVACCRRALQFRPDYADAHNNLGTLLTQLGRFDEAVASYRRALAITPDYADGHFNLAIALLSTGDMAGGWPEYEWRWRTAQLIKYRRGFPQPQWRGEAGGGRTLLIHAEQGFGDTMQFCRYATLAAARGLRVIIEVPGPLVRLLHSLGGVDRVIMQGDPLPAFDLHCPMASLPLAFGTEIATIPAPAAYLHPAAADAAAWGRRLDAIAKPGLRLGLVWAGSPLLHSDHHASANARRSVAPTRLAPLFECPGVHFVSLQKGGAEAPAEYGLTDFMSEMNDFADTAALIANLDLVISVDTAVAHLAASLGKPVWLLERFDSCWRWLSGRRDSPWYPSVRLYRQPQAGAWEPVLAEVARDLRDLTSHDVHRPRDPVAIGAEAF